MTDPQPKPRPYVRSGFVMRRIVNPLTVLLGGPTLVVRGRRSGLPIRVAVPAFAFEGARYLVGGGGETHWVRNLRASGEGELRQGRSREPFRAVELFGSEHDRVVEAYRRAMGFGPASSSRHCPIRPITRSSAWRRPRASLTGEPTAGGPCAMSAGAGEEWE